MSLGAKSGIKKARRVGCKKSGAFRKYLRTKK
jgi:hypothetical protein